MKKKTMILELEPRGKGQTGKGPLEKGPNGKGAKEEGSQEKRPRTRKGPPTPKGGYGAAMPPKGGGIGELR